MHSLTTELRTLAGRLDMTTRAWTVGVGRFLDGGGEIAPATLFAAAFMDEDYPTAPFPFSPADLVPDRDSAPAVHRARFDLDRCRHLETVLAHGDGFVAEALTRGGCLDDGSCAPSHVQLSDVEAVMADTVILLRTLAEKTGYTGRCAVAVDVLSDIPGSPLELRVFDEGSGDRLRPPCGYDSFDVVSLEFDVSMPSEEIQHVLWSACREMVLSFGVFDPQLVRPSFSLTA